MPGFGLHDVEADSVSRGGQPVPPEALILTPSRLRVRSSVVAGYAASQLLNAIFVLLLLFKLENTWQASWALIFAFLVAASLLDVPIRCYMLLHAARLMEVQVGSPPPASASTGMHLQYELVLRIRLRTHMCDNVTALVEALAHVAVKVLFGVLLSRDKLDTVAMRIILIPAWCAWATSVLLNCNKDASERSLISLRDVAYIFWLMVAWKVDGMAGYEWRLVFVIPWFWFAVVFLFGAVLVITLILAKAWARVQQLLLPMGFAAFLSAHVPLFVAVGELTSLLDGDTSVEYKDVLTPMAVALLTMGLSLGVMAWALREKERLRLRLLASGAVWTAHEGIARRMYPDREAAQQQVDEMSEEQVALMVQQRMAEKAKPQVLLRVGTTLYRCLPNSSSAATVQQLAGRGPTGNAGSPGSSQGGALEQQQGQGEQQQRQGGEPGEGVGTQQAGQPGGLQRLPEGHAQLQPRGQQCVQGQQQGQERQQQGPADQQEARLSPQASEGQEEGPFRAGQGQAHLATLTNLPLLHGGQSSTCQLHTPLPHPQHQPDIPMPPSSPTATQPLLPAVGAAPSLPDHQSLSTHPPAPLHSLSQSAHASTPSQAQAQALSWLLAGPHPAHHPSPSLLNSNQGAQVPWGSSLVSGAEPQTAALGARPQCLERGPGSMRATMGMGAGGLGVGGVTQGLATSTLTGLFDGRLLGLSTPNQVVPEEGVDDGLCVICYDKPSSCVFLDCGHGGFCKACAYRIFVRPPNECPTCRQHIEQVVELEEVRPTGQVSKVRQ